MVFSSLPPGAAGFPADVLHRLALDVAHRVLVTLPPVAHRPQLPEPPEELVQGQGERVGDGRPAVLDPAADLPQVQAVQRV
jgi:hypothetical protein